LEIKLEKIADMDDNYVTCRRLVASKWRLLNRASYWR